MTNQALPHFSADFIIDGICDKVPGFIGIVFQVVQFPGTCLAGIFIPFGYNFPDSCFG